VIFRRDDRRDDIGNVAPLNSKSNCHPEPELVEGEGPMHLLAAPECMGFRFGQNDNCD
jgi:hypothetical protein